MVRVWQGWLNSPTPCPIPAGCVTAWPAETARAMVEAYGCEGYIPKPIDTREFPLQVASYLNRPKP